MMNMGPCWIPLEHLDAARQTLSRKGGAPALDALRLERFDEGLSVQTLHVGPFNDEAPVLDSMHNEFIPAHSLRMTRKHHEGHLSDPRRTSRGQAQDDRPSTRCARVGSPVLDGYLRVKGRGS